jgi:Zn-dependent metalloprotease
MFKAALFFCVIGAVSAAGVDSFQAEVSRISGTDSHYSRWFQPVAPGSFRTDSKQVYNKRAGDIPVFGEHLIYYSDRAVQPELEKDLRTLVSLERSDNTDGITLEQAQKIAIHDLRTKHTPCLFPGFAAKEHNQEFWYRYHGEYHLVWYMTYPAKEQGIPVRIEYFVDQNQGVILNKIVGLQSNSTWGYRLKDDEKHSVAAISHTSGYALVDKNRNLEIYDQKLEILSTDSDGSWQDEGEQRKDNQRSEVELYFNMAQVIDVFSSRYNFRWKEGREPVRAIAHVYNNFNNAYFTASTGAFYFGDGSGKGAGFDYMTKALDVAAHEFGHGIMNQWSPLTYSDEPGTLNEHIADVMASIVDDDDWTIGESIALGDYKPGRNMQDPTWGHEDLLEWGMTFQEWEIMNRKSGLKMVVYPHRMGRKIVCSSWYQDQGGVHINAPIFNRFFYLASTGDGLERTGVTREKMGDIYMKLLKEKWLDKNSSFDKFKLRFLECAREYFRGDSKQTEYLETIERAFKVIEL